MMTLVHGQKELNLVNVLLLGVIVIVMMIVLMIYILICGYTAMPLKEMLMMTHF